MSPKERTYHKIFFTFWVGCARNVISVSKRKPIGCVVLTTMALNAAKGIVVDICRKQIGGHLDVVKK